MLRCILLAVLALSLPLPACGREPGPGAVPAARIGTAALARDARFVLRAIVAAAEQNQELPEPGDASFPMRQQRDGDELTALYVRAAARAARKLPGGQQAAAFLLALGIALDDSNLVRNNIVTRELWHQVEPEADRKRRLAVLGTPTIQGRHDLAQHFCVSAALTALHGKEAAEAAGILKEMLDTRTGGSGFSFADLSADLAGIAFAVQVMQDPSRLAGIEQSFRTHAYTLSPRGLPEGLSRDDFARQFGSPRDERFCKELAGLEQRLRRLPGFQIAPGRQRGKPAVAAPEDSASSND